MTEEERTQAFLDFIDATRKSHTWLEHRIKALEKAEETNAVCRAVVARALEKDIL